MYLHYCLVVIIAVYFQTQILEPSWRRGRRKIITISVSSKDTCFSSIMFVYCVIKWLSPNLCFALCSWKAEKIQHKWQNKGIRGSDTQIQWSVSFFPWNFKLCSTYFLKKAHKKHVILIIWNVSDTFVIILKTFWSKRLGLKLVLKTIINTKTQVLNPVIRLFLI